MKKAVLISLIIFLIVITTVTKNSSKNLESEIFDIKENISVLKYEYEMVLLDYNFLSSPNKLLEYQLKYFEDNLIPLKINEIKKIKEQEDQLKISEFVDIK